MDLSSNRVPENGSTQISEPNTAVEQRRLHAIDLVIVGSSSTIAIAVFIGIGYVVRHVAGPSAILCVLLAAALAYLIGKINIFIHATSLSIPLSLYPSLPSFLFPCPSVSLPHLSLLFIPVHLWEKISLYIFFLYFLVSFFIDPFHHPHSISPSISLFIQCLPISLSTFCPLACSSNLHTFQ